MKSISLTAILFLSSLINFAQQKDSLTANDYAHAEQCLFFNAQQYVDHWTAKPEWLQDDKFWYRTLSPQGSEFILVNAAKGTRSAAFDQQKLAAAISSATGKNYKMDMLPFRSFTYSGDNSSISFEANGKKWKADLTTYNIVQDSATVPAKEAKDNEVVSPDGNKAAFIKDYNLWVRDIATGKLTQLTTDGVQYFGYATDNAGWKHSDNAILRWSPDSKKIATFQQDERKAGDMYLVTTQVGHPKLEAWKYPLPGDSNIITIQRVIINIDAPKVIRLQVPADPHRGSLSDDVASSGTFDDVDWNTDATQLAFVSTSRDHKVEKFRIADAVTGTVREVFEESVATQYESGQGSINWRYLSKTHEIIWYSERDNWGHLYLYDATTGKVKNQITKGNWVVTQLLKVDEKKRILYFLADGKEPGNPYFTHFYKIGFDGKNLTSLTPETGNHEITLSPSGNYFVDDYSQPDVPDVMVLRNMNGKVISNFRKNRCEQVKSNRLATT